MKKLNIIGLFVSFVMAFAVSFLASQFVQELPVLETAITVTLFSAGVQYFAPSIFKGNLAMGLQVEIWKDAIEQKLLEDNAWLNAISNVDQSNILNGKVVHIPQAGNPSEVFKNRTQLPATISRRTDGEVLYVIDEYTTDPVLITDAEKTELSYDKTRSVLDQDVQNLSEKVAEGMLTNIIVSPVGSNNTLPATSILETNSAVNVASGYAGSTGNRKAYSLEDLQRGQNFFRKQKSWNEGQMNVLLTPDAAVQMFPANSNITATYMAAVTEDERRKGIMYKAQGFNIYVRSAVYGLASNNAFKAFGSVAAATDSEGILFWNKLMVEKAFGETKAFGEEGKPEYYGDVYSFLQRMGGRAKRQNFEGVLVMKQALTA